MTENEAIEILKKPCLCDYSLSDTIENCDISNCDRREATKMAISALEEIREYWALGTIDQIEEQMLLTVADKTILREYEELGTVEELREAIEKQRAKKYEFLHMLNDTRFKARCSCGYVFTADIDTNQNIKYCPNCGQAIDWSVEE